MLDKFNDIYNWVTSHKAALAIACGWFIHMGWPYIRDNGGVIGILKTFAFGKPTTKKENIT